jgi:hypothetical protein
MLSNVSERFKEKLDDAGISEEQAADLLNLKTEMKLLKLKLGTIETEVGTKLVSTQEDLESVEDDLSKLKKKVRRIVNGSSMKTELTGNDDDDD